MRPVNLLPESYRPRVASGSRSGSGYVALGFLAVLLVAIVAYAFTVNQVNSRNAEAASAEQEAVAAEQRAAELAPFGDFIATKEARLAGVRQLAESRFDWERLTRELSRLLPRRVWLTELSAATTPSDEASGAGAASEGPSATIVGCARSQSTVAVTLVRLRRLNRADDVLLGESSREDIEGGSTSDTSDCGEYFGFEATVALAPAEESTGQQESTAGVPASLGGGS